MRLGGETAPVVAISCITIRFALDIDAFEPINSSFWTVLDYRSSSTEDERKAYNGDLSDERIWLIKKGGGEGAIEKYEKWVNVEKI